MTRTRVSENVTCRKLISHVRPKILTKNGNVARQVWQTSVHEKKLENSL